MRIVSIRDVELARSVLPDEYNSEHLQAFHRHLFQDVFDWAGQFRTVDISKDGARFAHYAFLDDQVSEVLARLEADDWLTGLSRERFVARLAFYYGEINARHPFREGNGRTQRAFLRQLSASAGWHLDWSELNKANNIEASRRNLVAADTSMLVDVLTRVVVKI
ncbi:Fic family protein [Kibdelosporangium philippinense]|uniref:protein adenylyltransferase n=1 Tax=Kibdelosporangium philippinense TaxID=211113 RepID=A0ABS8ZGL3_9PSEU|nr:Fic family protein [Kibdelosporangium philippinense]MCE7006178.1 Fic family protein [Kibdelosporangium philippinense]